MKTAYKNLVSVTLSALVCVFLVQSASAQHRGSSGGGGGGGSSSPAPAPSRPSGGGSSGGSFSRPSSGSVGVSRPAPNFSRPAPSSAPRGGQAGGGYYRPGANGYTPRVGVSPRGNYGYAPRTGVNGRNGFAAPQTVGAPRGASYGGAGYRTSPQIGYGRGGYWGNHNYNYYNRGYYSSYYLPRLGFACDVLPYGYYPFYYGDYQYYYSAGLFYQYDNNQYTVVEPPVGAEVKTLPDNAQSIVINGQQYYELNGVYYEPVTKDDGTTTYQVAGKDGQLTTNNQVQDDQPQGPQMGDVVVQLPPDCRKIKVNGNKLYVSPDGVYYQEQSDANGAKSYKVVGLPSDEPEQN